jgi:hypothetical protein
MKDRDGDAGTGEVVEERALRRLLDEATVEVSRAARARQRWLRQAAEEDATFAGVLVDLAERGAIVTVQVAAGGRRSGRIVALGLDHLVLGPPPGGAGDERLVHLDAVVGVRPEPGGPALLGVDGRAPSGRTLVAVLAETAGDAPRVAITTATTEVVAGRLRAVGVDVVRLDLDDEARSPCYLSAAALREVVVFRSG